LSLASILELVDGLSMFSACWNFSFCVPVNSKYGDWLLIWFKYVRRVAAGTCGLPLLHSASENWFFQKPIVCGYSFWHVTPIFIWKVYCPFCCAGCSVWTVVVPFTVSHGESHVHVWFVVVMARASGFGFIMVTLSKWIGQVPLFWIV